MTRIRFLADECVSHNLLDFLRSLEPAIDVLAVNEPGAPRKGIRDPELIRAAFALGRTLISNDRSTLLRHPVAHFQAGGHTHGNIFLRSGFSIPAYAADLHLIWFCETADDGRDRIDFIPY